MVAMGAIWPVSKPTKDAEVAPKYAEKTKNTPLGGGYTLSRKVCAPSQKAVIRFTAATSCPSFAQ